MSCAELGITPVTVRRNEAPLDNEAVDAIRHALRGLRYGQIIVIVQDGVVVQVDRTERRRLRLNGRA
jgi:hypothetical protein